MGVLLSAALVRQTSARASGICDTRDDARGSLATSLAMAAGFWHPTRFGGRIRGVHRGNAAAWVKDVCASVGVSSWVSLAGPALLGHH
jgi:hypothetical protein